MKGDVPLDLVTGACISLCSAWARKADLAMATVRRLRAIDLYSGVGGWSLGLKLAGIEVVSSYELSPAANRTNQTNNDHPTNLINIRELDLDSLPTDIDIVVGSPPCTQFSFANKGGGGDLNDGLEDIRAFLKVVDHLKPRSWVMENVPRVASIIEKELKAGGKLEQFAHLEVHYHTLSMDKFGVPQRRMRCIIGRMDFEKLLSFQSSNNLTLGSITDSLKQNVVTDPIYRVSIPKSWITDNHSNDYLSSEEIRINSANKTLHPIYNKMPFPDPLNTTSRTITATCTRVSRESIVIEDRCDLGRYRRLSLRERACLQGFPITFQFYGDNFGQKLRMIGNAVPPPFAFFVGMAMKADSPYARPAISNFIDQLPAPIELPAITPPDRAAMRYPVARSFRFAIPSLRLNSGVRFELANDCEEKGSWGVRFIFGTSKSIQSIKLNEELYEVLMNVWEISADGEVVNEISELKSFLQKIDTSNLQALWAHRAPGLIRPFMLLDRLNDAASSLISKFDRVTPLGRHAVSVALHHTYGTSEPLLPGLEKLRRNGSLVLAGLLVGCVVNMEIGGKAAICSEGGLKLAV